ncbi:uncharacterized protein LOC131619839 [Vicia villosa]|uniref:uncharacterized protein LOC131619839 n=1 Tax=Vicia villosa TaxID=3911 RepID=UPI00273C5E50|nr:uncharacterized protein LOC131619839 [Vicia villosa]
MEPTSHITVLVKYTGEINQVCFKMKRNTSMKKLMNSYCDRYSLHFNSTAFLFDSRLISPNLSPFQLNLKDGDVIDAAFHEDCIEIKVKGQNGFEASYVIRRTDPLRNIMDKYCLHYRLNFDAVGFLFDGRLTKPEETPYKLGIQNGDEILVMLHMSACGVLSFRMKFD